MLLALSSGLAGGLFGGTLCGMGAARAETLDFDAFAMDPAITGADVSPDGTRLAVVRRFAKDGDPVIEIYDTKNLAAKPKVLGGGRMIIRQAGWVNDDFLLVVLTQTIEEGENTFRVSKIAVANRDGSDLREIPNGSTARSEQERRFADFRTQGIVSLLPDEPNHILMSYDDDLNGVADVVKVDVRTGALQRVFRGNDRMGGYSVDRDGDVRLAFSIDAATRDPVVLARAKGSDEWKEIGRTRADETGNSQTFAPVGFLNDEDPNEIVVISNHESDTASIYAMDVTTGRYTELLFRHPDYDAGGVATLTAPGQERRWLGFAYTADRSRVYWLDGREEALYEQINAVLPGGANTIVSRSVDEQTMVIRQEAPQIPGHYYLLKDGKLQFIGSEMPLLTKEALSPAQWTSFTARDGLEIPTIVTRPKGEGPFPAVVMPHGGPVARDVYGFDLWAQVLAHHGYLVIQPQFRISSGFGRKHLEAGFAQWGLTQQDDIDDSVLWAVEQGWADKDRLAIFGWSYGGYAAQIGSFREPRLYKCAISGAGASDLNKFRAWLFQFGRGTQATYRKTVKGVNPIEHVAKFDIPILVIHGDIDERVPVSHSRDLVSELKRHNKQHKYVELEGANHFFGTIYYRHWMEMFPAMIDWLDNTCDLKN